MKISFLSKIEYLTVKQTLGYTVYAMLVCAFVAILSIGFDRVIQTIWKLF